MGSLIKWFLIKNVYIALPIALSTLTVQFFELLNINVCVSNREC